GGRRAPPGPAGHLVASSNGKTSRPPARIPSHGPCSCRVPPGLQIRWYLIGFPLRFRPSRRKLWRRKMGVLLSGETNVWHFSSYLVESLCRLCQWEQEERGKWPNCDGQCTGKSVPLSSCVSSCSCWF